jgi:hypothetical protein
VVPEGSKVHGAVYVKESTIILANTGNYLSNNTASHPRRTEPPATPL